jgi:hypothetical protein
MGAFGSPKTAKYCVEQVNATSDKFYYNLKNKYDCLLDPRNDEVTLSSKTANCANKYFVQLV